MSSLALMQMWVPEELPCVSKTSWGSLDQEDTRCLFQGIPDHEDLDMGPLEPSDAVTLYALLASLGCNAIDCCDGKSFVFTPQVII